MPVVMMPVPPSVIPAVVVSVVIVLLALSVPPVRSMPRALIESGLLVVSSLKLPVAKSWPVTVIAVVPWVVIDSGRVKAAPVLRVTPLFCAPPMTPQPVRVSAAPACRVVATAEAGVALPTPRVSVSAAPASVRVSAPVALTSPRVTRPIALVMDTSALPEKACKVPIWLRFDVRVTAPPALPVSVAAVTCAVDASPMVPLVCKVSTAVPLSSAPPAPRVTLLPEIVSALLLVESVLVPVKKVLAPRLIVVAPWVVMFCGSVKDEPAARLTVLLRSPLTTFHNENSNEPPAESVPPTALAATALPTPRVSVSVLAVASVRFRTVPVETRPLITRLALLVNASEPVVVKALSVPMALPTLFKVTSPVAVPVRVAAWMALAWVMPPLPA